MDQRTDSTEDLQARQEELERQANQFKATSDKLRKQIKRKNNRLSAMICCLFCCCPCITVAN